MRLLKKKSFRVTISFYVISLFTISSLIIIGCTYYYNTKAMLRVADNLITQMTNTIIEKTVNYLSPASDIAIMSSRFVNKGVISMDNKEKLELFAIEALKIYPQLAMFNIGDEHGNFLMPKKMPDGTISTKIISRSPDNASVTWKYRNLSDEVIRIEAGDKVVYDPRARPWYKGAKQLGEIYWSDISIFFTDKKLGITAAYPVRDNNQILTGVFGLDIELGELSKFMKKLSDASSGVVFIFNHKNELVAYPDISSIVTKTGKKLRPTLINELKNDCIKKAFNQFEETKKKKFVFDFQQNEYIASYVPFPDSFGKDWTIGIIIPMKVIMKDINKDYKIILMFSLILLVVGILLIFDFARKISKPIVSLTKKIGQLKCLTFESQITIFTSIKEVQVLTATFNDMVVKLHTAAQKQKQAEAVEVAAQARREFLDNSGQGFLSFGHNLLTGNEYSRECESIFGLPIAGEPITTLLCPTDAVSKANLEKNFINILSEKDDYKQELYLSLLKKEYHVKDKFIEAEYKIIAKSKMMLILTDVTRQKKLENTVQNERNRLRFVVSAIRESNYFFEILNAFEKFYKHDFPKLSVAENDQVKIMAELYRNIHTFKGLFAQQGFPNIPNALHKMEDHLSKIRQNKTGVTCELSDLMETYGCMVALNKDLVIIEEMLGKEFLRKKERRNDVVVSREQAKKIEVMAQRLIELGPSIIDEETRGLLRETEKILQANLKDLIGFYLNNAIKLANRLKKDIGHFGVEGDDVFVDTATYSPFIRTLVHVFRNAVDHGIETSEEREELGKEEDALLICSVKKNIDKQTGDQIIISISDNGRGLDTARIRNKAVERGILTKEDAHGLPDSEIHHIIFNENFSTSETVTELSGRGVGLDSVRTELSKLGGKIEIKTELKRGTTFRFIIPIKK